MPSLTSVLYKKEMFIHQGCVWKESLDLSGFRVPQACTFQFVGYISGNETHLYKQSIGKDTYLQNFIVALQNTSSVAEKKDPPPPQLIKKKKKNLISTYRESNLILTQSPKRKDYLEFCTRMGIIFLSSSWKVMIAQKYQSSVDLLMGDW